MADILIRARSNKPGSSEITLADGVAIQAYRLALPGPDWGNAIWESVYSGTRGTQGARSAGGEVQNRPVLIPLQVRGATQDNLQALLSPLWRLSEEMRRYGGLMTMRPQGGSFKQYLDVLDAGARVREYDRLFRVNNIVTVELGFVCAPYLRFDSFDIFDDFSTETSADYAIDAGTGFGISGGQLVPTSTGVKRWRHTGKGYSYGDVDVTLKIRTGGSVVGYTAEVFCAADTGGAETFFAAQVTDSALNVVTRTAGTPTTNATTAFSPSANTTYWLRLRRVGDRLSAAIFSSEPSPLATPAATVSHTLTVGFTVLRAIGHTGFRINVVNTSERYDDFRVEPNTYGGPSTFGTRSLIAPDELQIRPALIGDGPGLADVSITAAGGTAPIWAMFAWWRRPSVWNYVYNGDFEDDVNGWTTAGVSGVTGACTSFTRSTSAARNKYGGANGEIVCPATANTGVAFRMDRRFYRDRTYLVLVWASSAAGTTLARIRLGVSGDLNSSSARALTTTPSLYTVLWAPTAERDGAYVAAEITAATGTTWNIDGVVVVETRPAPLTNSIDSSQITCVVDRVPDDWPAPPFLAWTSGVVPAELIRVEGISGNTLTIARGQEGTTAAAQAAGNHIVPIPELRYQLEGKGAQPAHGVIEGESDDDGNRYNWAVTADANARSGNLLKATSISGAGSVAADYLIDPHLHIQDDFALDELSVEVWARLWIHAGLTNPTCTVHLAPETATVASGVMISNYGTIRNSEEYGITGKLLIKPSSGGAYRYGSLGTVKVPVDRTRPQRYRLQVRITWTAATSGEIGLDYLTLVPAYQRCLSPTHMVNGGNYPKFILSTNETTKTIRSDLSGLNAKPPGSAGPDHGLGGSLIELPYGPVDSLLKTSTLVPDDPTSHTSSEADPTASSVVHLAVTPRGTLARGS